MRYLMLGFAIIGGLTFGYTPANAGNCKTICHTTSSGTTICNTYC